MLGTQPRKLWFFRATVVHMLAGLYRRMVHPNFKPDLLHKLSYIRIGGMLVPYISHYTMANRNIISTLDEDGLGFQINYPASCQTSQFKYSRSELPQVNKDSFLKDCHARGIIVQNISEKPSNLSPIQGEFNEGKVLNMIGSDISPEPIITTRDNHIIDGHHRWLAHYNLGDKPIQCSQVNLNIHQALDFLNNKEYTEFKGLHESLIQIVTEDANLRLGLQCLSEMISNGVEPEIAVEQAASLCEHSPADLTVFLEMCRSAFSGMLVEDHHPMRVMRRILKNGKAESITFKDGTTYKVKPDTAFSIIHTHHYMNKGSKGKIERMVHKNRVNFDKIAKWSDAHTTALRESVDIDAMVSNLPAEELEDDQMNLDVIPGKISLMVNPAMPATGPSV